MMGAAERFRNAMGLTGLKHRQDLSAAFTALLFAT